MHRTEEAPRSRNGRLGPSRALPRGAAGQLRVSASSSSGLLGPVSATTPRLQTLFQGQGVRVGADSCLRPMSQACESPCRNLASLVTPGLFSHGLDCNFRVRGSTQLYPLAADNASRACFRPMETAWCTACDRSGFLPCTCKQV